jgi:hypothetical protein
VEKCRIVKGKSNMNDTQFLLFTSAEDDIAPLFTTKFQENACVAHLKGTFITPKTLSLTWLKRSSPLFSASFQSEVHDLLKYLQNGPLHDLNAMRNFCTAHPRAYMQNRQAFYAFRIDSSQHRYYLRIFPQEGKNKFFLFCYRIDRMRDDLPSPDFNFQYRSKTTKKKKERDR